MILCKEDSLYASKLIIDYFSNFGRIDDYFRARKIERVKGLPPPLFGMSVEDDMFQDWETPPDDMDFEVVQMNNEIFDQMLEMTASFSPDEAPGKTLKLVVKEKNTNKAVGFIKMGSPLINSKPRNDYLGGVPDLGIFNQRAIMGFNIVPVQPFGFNYLGGKLMAGICCSHEVRRMLDKKYKTEFCLFETTSLYGNIKGASMYDGMRPFLRYKGDTQSQFLLTMGEDMYFHLRDWFTEKNDGEELIHKGASSRKLKMQTKMVGIVKASLKEHDADEYKRFTDTIKSSTDVTTNKRFYMSEYGYSNAKDVLLGKTDTLQKAENFDRFELPEVIKWWKKLATKRHNNLMSDGRIRKELEVWNQNTIDKIDIIR